MGEKIAVWDGSSQRKVKSTRNFLVRRPTYWEKKCGRLSFLSLENGPVQYSSAGPFMIKIPQRKRETTGIAAGFLLIISSTYNVLKPERDGGTKILSQTHCFYDEPLLSAPMVTDRFVRI